MTTITNGCPLREDGVHQLGVETSCKCGFVLTIPRFHFSVEIHDNGTRQDLAEEGFSCSDIATIKEKLREIADKL